MQSGVLSALGNTVEAGRWSRASKFSNIYGRSGLYFGQNGAVFFATAVPTLSLCPKKPIIQMASDASGRSMKLAKNFYHSAIVNNTRSSTSRAPVHKTWYNGSNNSRHKQKLCVSV